MTIKRCACRALEFWRDDDGQDLIEYALMAATVAIACAGFLAPFVTPGISSIFSKVISLAAVS